ncbi:MAG: glycosyltransferase, partial [Planctomycetota bacterium]|nr:glycosyltransferase [Planctomycetota bacterium]
MARMILIAIGSSGDVHPLLGIAEELARRNHEVIVLTNPRFESLVKRLGFEFRPLGKAAEFDAVADDPDVWHRVRGVRLLVKWAIVHTLRPIYETLRELYIPDQTVVAAPLTAFGARIAQESFGIPLATIHLQPVVFRSVYDTPSIPPMLTGGRVPHWLKRFQYYLADR